MQREVLAYLVGPVTDSFIQRRFFKANLIFSILFQQRKQFLCATNVQYKIVYIMYAIIFTKKIFYPSLSDPVRVKYGDLRTAEPAVPGRLCGVSCAGFPHTQTTSRCAVR